MGFAEITSDVLEADFWPRIFPVSLSGFVT